MNDCDKYLYLIDDLIEGELDFQLAAQVEQHVGVCPECRAEFAAAKQEKSLYANFLADAEPSAALRANFYARLEAADEPAQTAPISETAANWKTRAFGFLNFSPAFATAALIVALGMIFGVTKLVFNEKSGGNDIASDVKTNDSRLMTNDSKPIEQNEVKDFAQKNELPKIVKAARQNAAQDSSGKISREKIKSAKTPQSLVAQTKKNDEKIKNKENIAAPRRKFDAQTAQISEEEKNRRALLAALETEAARQIEKVELLLRSFRNARSADDGEIFDVAYEREQARKLLEKNVRLRRDAENFGTLYAEELLGRVEPLLLDIANLDKNAAPERVRDIKERVRNQNIIASLQIY